MADNVSLWDGVAFKFMPRADAEKLEANGGCQIATGLANTDLKTQAVLRKEQAAMKRKTPANTKPAQNYSTRDMQAQAQSSAPAAGSDNEKVTTADESSNKDAAIPGFA